MSTSIWLIMLLICRYTDSGDIFKDDFGPTVLVGTFIICIAQDIKKLIK